MPPKGEIENIPQIGGKLCLDFVNTIDWRGQQEKGEYLNDYSDLLLWSRNVGILSDVESSSLETRSLNHKDEAKNVYIRAIDYRESIYKVFSNIAKGEEPQPSDIQKLNEELSRASPHGKIVKTETGYSMGFDEQSSLDRMLWPISSSVVDLLTSADLSRVKSCGSDECGWLFYDTSKNKSRRWCEMKGCGNRMKAKRHYSKTVATQL